MAGHDHPPEGPCPPSCPGWAEGAVELLALQRRYAELRDACAAAERIECLIVAPAVPGVELPVHLQEEQLVRLNLVVGRDCREVLLDEWGVRVTLTFNRRRHDCALPWESVVAGLLAAPPPPARPRPRFGVIEGGGPPGGAPLQPGQHHPGLRLAAAGQLAAPDAAPQGQPAGEPEQDRE